MSKTQLKQGLLIVVILLSLNSCATVSNGRFSNVNVQTARTTNLVIEGDTILRETNDPVYLRVRNNRAPLEISAFDSTGNKNVFVYSKTHGSYWANFLTVSLFFTGFIVDEVTGLKRTYPRNVYIDPDGVGNSYLPYFPMDSSLLVRKNKITFAPISIIHEYHPAFEIGYERMHKGNFATQVSFGLFRSWDTDFARNSSGFKASIEEKYFFRSAGKARFYIALALEHHNKRHDADIAFLTTDNMGRILFDSRFTQRVRVDKKFTALTPRVGIQTYISSRLVLEGFYGLGLRHRRVRHLNTNPNAVVDDDLDEFLNFNANSNDPGNSWSSNWDLNIRLAWTF